MNRILITALLSCLAFWCAALWGILSLANYLMRGF